MFDLSKMEHGKSHFFFKKDKKNIEIIIKLAALSDLYIENTANLYYCFFSSCFSFSPLPRSAYPYLYSLRLSPPLENLSFSLFLSLSLSLCTLHEHLQKKKKSTRNHTMYEPGLNRLQTTSNCTIKHLIVIAKFTKLSNKTLNNIDKY